jgi:two-component system CheB/CheR fusion protein
MTDAADSTDLEALLGYLQRTRGFDFTAYKRPSLLRRIQKRLDQVGIKQFAHYTDYLEVHPEEFANLFDVLLINVTAFFRDEPSWDYVRDEVLPSIVGGTQQIRIWSAGCASGEEPYSIAMLLADALGRDAFRDRVKIYATDMDDGALAEARAAIYTEKDVQVVPPPLRERYFVRDKDRFVFDKELRRAVIFGRHDLLQDAPISRVNLLICRNTLMYFNSEAQSRILTRFHFALTEPGLLFLGRAEMLFAHGQLFAPVDLRRRVFKKVQKESWRDRLALMNLGEDPLGAATHAELAAGAFDVSPHAQIVIDAAGALAMFNERARTLFNLGTPDVGRPLQDFELSYRPVELRSLIEQAVNQRRPVEMRDVEWPGASREPRFVDVAIVPLLDGARRSYGVSVTFADVTRAQELQVQLTRSRQDLETAYEELQSTNEELETTNEELQSTVEELETTNEELQSTNEELETMNEELQSTNEELQTINDELRKRGDDLNRANGFLEAILKGVRSGVIVLDRELRVLAWNHRAEDMWGVRADEATGQNFLNMDIGLPLEQLRAGIRACLNGDGEHAEVVVSATNRRGKTISCKVAGTPLVGATKEVRGVILLMEEQPTRVH